MRHPGISRAVDRGAAEGGEVMTVEMTGAPGGLRAVLDVTWCRWGG